jgi:hypothetical protein
MTFAHRMTVRVSGTTFGIMIDTDPTRSFEHNRQMAMKAATDLLNGPLLECCIYIGEGDPRIVGEIHRLSNPQLRALQGAESNQEEGVKR